MGDRTSAGSRPQSSVDWLRFSMFAFPLSVAGAPLAASFVGLVSLAACASDGTPSKDESEIEYDGNESTAPSGDDSMDAGPTRPSVEDCRGRGDDLSKLEIEGDSGGTLTVQVVEPDPPALGDNVLTVVIRVGDKPLSDLAGELFVTPLMPDHGHGTPVRVDVHEIDDGAYQLAPVNTFMPGFWEISIEVDSEPLKTVFIFGVCVG